MALSSPAFVVGTGLWNSFVPGSLLGITSHVWLRCHAKWAFNFFTTSSAVLLVNLSTSKKLE